MTCNECRKYPGCMERSREYICREFKYDGGYNKSEASRIGNGKGKRNGDKTKIIGRPAETGQHK